MVAPGTSQNQFELRSTCKPGFTTALFSSGTLVNLDQKLPTEVFEQLKFYDDPTWGKVPALTFGPMFCEGTSERMMAENFLAGSRRLIELNEIASTSMFVSDMLTALQTGGTVVFHRPREGKEYEVFRALQMNLRFRIETGRK